jgi:hypothetical protein
MNAASVVLEARLALALDCIAALQAMPEPVEAATYGRRAGDRLVDFVSHDVHFGNVYQIGDVLDARADHGTDINAALFTGKAA